VYSAWNRARLATNTPIVSLSHPKGDTARLALGATSAEYRVEGRPQDMYGVRFSRGIIEPGSSGSGLFVMNGTSLQLRGVLSGTTVRQAGGMSCSNLGEEGLFARLEIFAPEIDPYVRLAPQAADDAPNRAQDLFAAALSDPNGTDQPLDLRATPLVLAGKRIDYAGDVDVYRFTLTRESTVRVWTDSAIDTVGTLLDAQGVDIEANDDERPGSSDYNFGVTRSLAPGTYYVLVAHFDADGTGAYALNLSAAPGATAPASAINYTDLWWNAAESGWGLNLNHQGSIVFGTLFTYDANGAPLWLVMSRGDLQSDGSFSGALYRTTGPAFNAAPWVAATPAAVGTMRVSFQNSGSGTLSYSVNGTTVSKAISRQSFSNAATCSFTTGDRASATNYQDLWWNPSESGWGVNVTHQGNIIFATLFTYDANGQAKWFVLARGERSGPGAYSGTLYSTTGTAFDASSWTPSSTTPVGTMAFSFPSGNSGTLSYSVNGVPVTKAIQRQAFSSPMTQCR
jgi:hypothetical protein